MKKKGFTLIELMIVLAIIAITATLVISNLASSRKAGNETSAIKGVRAGLEAQGVFKKSGQGTARGGDSDGDNNPQEFCGALADLLDVSGVALVPYVTTNPYHGYQYDSTCTADPEVSGFVECGPVTFAADGDREFAASTAHGGCFFNTPAGGGLPGQIPWDITAQEGPAGWLIVQE